MKNLYYPLIAALLLAVGCTKERLPLEEGGPHSGSGSLRYEVADFDNRSDDVATRAITPSDDEFRITSVCYLFFNQRSQTCVGYRLYDGLDVHAQTGRLPFELPESVPTTDGVYVRVIANFQDYKPDASMTDERYAESFFGMREDAAATLLSDLGYGSGTTMKPYREVGDPLLMTGRFAIDLNQNSHSVTLVRKQVALDIDIVKPDWIAAGTLTLSDLPRNVALFTANYLAKPDVSSQTYSLPVENERTRLYIFPSNTDGAPVKVSLDVRKPWEYIEVSKSTTSSNIPSTDYKQEYSETTYEQVKKRSVTLAMPDHALPIRENHYVLFSIQQSVSNHRQLEMRMNGWSVESPFTGKILQDKEGNGIALSSVALTLPYADTAAMPLSDYGTPPSGETQAKIYMPTYGFPPQWEIGEIGESWLSAEKADNGQSLLVTARPNLTFNSDGTLSSSVRHAYIRIQIYFTDGSSKTEEITVTQQASPGLGTVTIGYPYVTASGEYYDGPFDYGYLHVIGHNAGATPGKWGTLSTDGNFYGSRDAIGTQLKRGFGTSGEVDMNTIIRDTEVRATLCPSNGLGISADEAVFLLYPRIRRDYFDVDGKSVQIYYMPGKTGTAVFPILSNLENVPTQAAGHQYLMYYTFEARTNDRVRFTGGISNFPQLDNAGKQRYWAYGLGVFGGKWEMYKGTVPTGTSFQTYVRCQYNKFQAQ